MCIGGLVGLRRLCHDAGALFVAWSLVLYIVYFCICICVRACVCMFVCGQVSACMGVRVYTFRIYIPNSNALCAVASTRMSGSVSVHVVYVCVAS